MVGIRSKPSIHPLYCSAHTPLSYQAGHRRREMPLMWRNKNSSQPEVQHPEALWALQMARARISECQRHNPEWNMEHLWIYQAPKKSCSKNASGSWRQTVRNRKRSNLHDQGPEWDEPLTNRGSGWHQEILPVARKELLKGQHRGSDHGSTRTGPKHQTHRGRSLPKQIGPADCTT